MALKLSGQQIEALVEKEYKALQTKNAKKIKEFKESEAYITGENNIVAEYNRMSPELKSILYSSSREDTIRTNYWMTVGQKQLNLPLLPNKQDLREKLIIATIDCDNLQEVLKNAGFTLTI